MIYSRNTALLLGAAGASLVAGYYLYKKIATKKKYDVVFVLGGPGAGKGTQSALINETYGYVHLSAGDLLRAERASGSGLADMINNYIKEGKIVPAEITTGLLKTAMNESGATKFLVDGFPRDIGNLECWEKTMSDCSNIQFLLFLDCPQEVMLNRLLERGKTSGRSDDNVESIKKRFTTYEQATRPIIDHFIREGKCRTVDSVRPVEAVFADVKKIFDSA
jgi:UMP-CMP kinase